MDSNSPPDIRTKELVFNLRRLRLKKIKRKRQSRRVITRLHNIIFFLYNRILHLHIQKYMFK